MTKIAITGNIASGKSIVEGILREKGYSVYDTDKMVHEILESSDEVKRAFASYDVFEDGKISRQKLGKHVFVNVDLRQKLEQIIHPLIKKMIENLDEELVFVAVPLLFEAKMEGLFDKIIFISAPVELRLERLMARNNLSKEDALARINAQQPEEEKIRKSDFVIINDGEVKTALQQINEYLKSVLF